MWIAYLYTIYLIIIIFYHHSHIILESKLERAIPKAIKGDIGGIMSKLNLESFTLPNNMVSSPS